MGLPSRISYSLSEAAGLSGGTRLAPSVKALSAAIKASRASVRTLHSSRGVPGPGGTPGCPALERRSDARGQPIDIQERKSAHPADDAARAGAGPHATGSFGTRDRDRSSRGRGGRSSGADRKLPRHAPPPVAPRRPRRRTGERSRCPANSNDPKASGSTHLRSLSRIPDLEPDELTHLLRELAASGPLALDRRE